MMPSTEVADEVWTDDAQASVAVPSHSTWVADELRLEALARQAGWTPLSASSPRDIEEPLGLSGWSDVIRLLDPRHRAPSGLSAAAYAERRAMRRSLSGMGAAILALHVLGWGILLVMVLGHRDGAATTFFGLGLGATVYALGLRHAFDADHIAAIDNTTRKLVQDGQRPLSVGFWFSLGHSTVVFVVCLLLSLGVRALAGQLGDGSQLRDVFGVVGTIVSSVFLLVLAVINLFSFAGTLRLAGRVR
ncbi:MAG: hypothetical protein FWF75_09545, partial [Propionibacteriaceae bacterium]|nr:hypothetical protein [Propionibacteriaceae bacterium]